MDQGQKVPSQINDDELTQMIAGLKNASSTVAPTPINNTVQQSVVNNPTPAPAPKDLPVMSPVTPASPVQPSAPVIPESAKPTDPANVESTPIENMPTVNNLESIKRDAILELRPLVDKLNLPAEDKFDALLLLIRTTDDASLIPEAHHVAISIADDTRRAQALLDIIKEIDFFDHK